MSVRILLPLLLVAFGAPVFAQAPQEREPSAAELEQARAAADAWQDYATRVARALGRSDGARDLALATVLEATARPAEGAGIAPPAAEATAWSEAAASRGAGDAITQQLLLAAAIAGGDPDAAEAAARRWQALSPGNLAPALFQGLPADAVLAAAARASHNAPDPFALQRWVAGTMRRHPPTAAEWAAFGDGSPLSPDASAALVAVTAQGLLVPDYREVLGACTGRQLGESERAAACRHMSGLLLSRPQTVLDERIGLSMARALTRSIGERAPLDARRRGVDWRQEQMAGLAMGDGRGAGVAQAHVRALADTSIDTEEALVRRILSEAGVALEPPADWRAPWERPAR